MSKKKYIQVSEEFFLNLCKFFMLEMYEYEDTIKKQINEKLDSLEKRRLYTEYKTVADSETKEAARKKYLDKVGMNEDFRW